MPNKLAHLEALIILVFKTVIFKQAKAVYLVILQNLYSLNFTAIQYYAMYVHMCLSTVEILKSAFAASNFKWLNYFYSSCSICKYVTVSVVSLKSL